MITRRVAFTLIELLTVIAIIAILAAMIFPSFARAREMARRASCQSNMKQLGLGFQQYIQDYDDRYPFAGNWQHWADGGHWVAGVNGTGTDGSPGALAKFSTPYTATGAKAFPDKGALYPYIKSVQVYVCPSSRDGQKTGLSYGMNWNLGGQSSVAIQEDSQLVLLVDEAYPTDGFFWATDNPTASDQIQQIHNGTGNILFCDGHVKAYPFARFPAGDNGDSNASVAAASQAIKISTTSSPRFNESGGLLHGTFDPSATPTPAPTATPSPTPGPTPTPT